MIGIFWQSQRRTKRCWVCSPASFKRANKSCIVPPVYIKIIPYWNNYLGFNDFVFFAPGLSQLNQDALYHAEKLFMIYSLVCENNMHNISIGKRKISKNKPYTKIFNPLLGKCWRRLIFLFMVYLALIHCETSRLALQIDKRELSSELYSNPLIDIISSTKYKNTVDLTHVFTNIT